MEQRVNPNRPSEASEKPGTTAVATGAPVRRRRRGLLVAACVLAVAAMAVGTWQAAAGGYLTKPVAHWLGARLGRSLALDGGLRIEIGRVTRVSATGLRLGNVAWGGRPTMLAARSVVLEIDTWSLLRDTLIVRQLTVAGLDLLLERNVAGQNNWTFELHHKGPASALPLVIDAASLPGARIRFSGPQLDRPLDVVLDTVEQREQADGMLDLSVSGQANATALAMQLSVGPFANLVDARDFRFQGTGNLGEIVLAFAGHVDSLAAPINTEVSLKFEAPDADYLASRLGWRGLGTGAVALELKVLPAADAGGIQGNAFGQIGEFEVKAQGSLVPRSGSNDYVVEAHVAGPELSRLGHFTGIKGLPAEPFRLQLKFRRTRDAVSIQQADLELADGRLALNGTLGPGGALAGSELAFQASTPDVAKIEKRLGVAVVASGPLSVTGTVRQLESGETRLLINGTTALGRFSLAGPIGVAPEFYGTRMDVTASGDEFAPLGKVLQIPDPPAGAFSGTGQVEWGRGGFLLRGARLTAGGESLTLDGLLGRPLLATGANLRFDLRGANAARMAGRLGAKGMPVAGYHALGTIRRLTGRAMSINIEAAVAGATLKLDGTLGKSPGFAATDLAFVVNGPALSDFAGLFPDLEAPHSAFRANGNLAIVDGKTLRLSNVQASVADAQGTLFAELALPLDSRAMHFNVAARIPDPAKLLAAVGGVANLGKNFEVIADGTRQGERWSFSRLRFASDHGLISTQGELILIPGFSAQNVQLEIRAASLRRAGLPSGRVWPDQPLELRARFSRSEKSVALENLTGRLGNSDFSGHIIVRGLDAKPDYDVQLGSSLLDLDAYLQRPRSSAPAGIVPAAAPDLRGSRRLVIPDTALPIPHLSDFTGKLALRAQKLRLWGQEFTDLQVQTTLRDGRLQVDPLAVTGAAGQINLKGTLVAMDKGVQAHISGSGKNLALTPVPIEVGGPNASRYTARVDLRGAGNTLRALAGSLNGQLRLVGVGGRVANSLLMRSSNTFMKQLVSSLNPVATRQPTSEVDCVAYLLTARDGVLTTDPALVMRTAEVDIIANGTTDLRSEKIDFSFKTGARRGLGLGVAQLINPYIKVTGTLGNPGVTLDPTGTLVNGGAAFATAGLSIVATTVWDRMVHEKDPCGAAVAEADRRARD